MNPILEGGRLGCPKPIKIKLNVPITATRRPHAVETVIAFRIAKPQYSKKGTNSVPPPTPNKPDKKPIALDPEIIHFVLTLTGISEGLL